MCWSTSSNYAVSVCYMLPALQLSTRKNAHTDAVFLLHTSFLRHHLAIQLFTGNIMTWCNDALLVIVASEVRREELRWRRASPKNKIAITPLSLGWFAWNLIGESGCLDNHVYFKDPTFSHTAKNVFIMFFVEYTKITRNMSDTNFSRFLGSRYMILVLYFVHIAKHSF